MDLNKVTGFKNYGNTCYLNSCLQLLFNCDLFNNNLCNLKNIENKFLKGYIITLKDYYNLNIETIGPKILYNYLKKNYEQFDNHHPQDSSESLICLLDSIYENLKKNKLDNIFERYFNFKIDNTILCHETNKKFISNNKENVICLSIPEKDNISFDECLRNYSKKEIFNDKNKYFNDKINKYVDATKIVSINTYPIYLFFILKRYNFDKYSNKINNKIQIPFNYNFNDHKYNLCGFITQMGNLNDGHYISIIQKKNKWYLCNDNTINEINDNKLQNYLSISYILLFKKNI